MNAGTVYAAFREEIQRIQKNAYDAGANDHPRMTAPERKRRLSYARSEGWAVLNIARRLNLSDEMLGVKDLSRCYEAGVEARITGVSDDRPSA